MSAKRPISDKEKSTASLRELRAILAKTPEAAKIFDSEINRRWSIIPIEQRQWVCKLAGCADGTAEKKYTEIDGQNRARIRGFIAKMKRMVGAFEFALSQW